MELNITIKLENAAFEEYPAKEGAQILRELADRIEDGELGFGQNINIQDVNGNNVGKAQIL